LTGAGRRAGDELIADEPHHASALVLLEAVDKELAVQVVGLVF